MPIGIAGESDSIGLRSERFTLFRGREERVFDYGMEKSYRVEKPDAHQPFLPCLPRARTGYGFS